MLQILIFIFYSLPLILENLFSLKEKNVIPAPFKKQFNETWLIFFLVLCSSIYSGPDGLVLASMVGLSLLC